MAAGVHANRTRPHVPSAAVDEASGANALSSVYRVHPRNPCLAIAQPHSLGSDHPVRCFTSGKCSSRRSVHREAVPGPSVLCRYASSRGGEFGSVLPEPHSPTTSATGDPNPFSRTWTALALRLPRPAGIRPYDAPLANALVVGIYVDFRLPRIAQASHSLAAIALGQDATWPRAGN